MLVVFRELTSILSFLLIGYWHQGQAARGGADRDGASGLARAALCG